MPLFILKQNSGLRSAPGLRGEGLDGAMIGKGEIIELRVGDRGDGFDRPSPYDHWYQVIDKRLVDPVTHFYLHYGKPAWIEEGHVAPYEQGGGDPGVTRTFTLVIPPVGQGVPTISEN